MQLNKKHCNGGTCVPEILIMFLRFFIHGLFNAFIFCYTCIFSRTAFFVLGLMASTREGAELLTQYGWEARWTKRSEYWPLVEDRATLLETSMDDTRSEAGYSVSRFELGSPVSNLDFIAEEHFQLGKPVKSWTRSISETGDRSYNQTYHESGVHIPGVRTSGSYGHDSRMLPTRAKSQTLPSRYESLPTKTFRSISVSPSKLADERTSSIEQLVDKKFLDLSLGPKDRSQSLNLEVLLDSKQKDKGGDSNVKKDTIKSMENSVIDESKSSKLVPLKISIGDEVLDQSALPLAENKGISNLKSDIVASALEDTTVSHSSVVKTDSVVQIPESNTLDIKDDSLKESERKEGESLKEGEKSVDSKAPVIKPKQNQMISISITDTDNEVHEESDVNVSVAMETKGGNDINRNSSGNGVPVGNNGCQTEVHKQEKFTEKSDGQIEKRTGSLKDERSSSSESSRTTKSRTDSFNTDSTTSGIGSFDSGHHGMTELHTLTPIPSSTSLENFEVQIRPKKTDREIAHHSVALRRLSNLSRVPSSRRQSSPGVGLLPISKFFDFSESAITYTTARDAIGYATLRSLMKQRQISSDVESDYGLNNLYDTSSIGSTSRRPSVDSTYLEAKRPLRLVFNMLLCETRH